MTRDNAATSWHIPYTVTMFCTDTANEKFEYSARINICECSTYLMGRNGEHQAGLAEKLGQLTGQGRSAQLLHGDELVVIISQPNSLDAKNKIVSRDRNRVGLQQKPDGVAYTKRSLAELFHERDFACLDIQDTLDLIFRKVALELLHFDSHDVAESAAQNNNDDNDDNNDDHHDDCD